MKTRLVILITLLCAALTSLQNAHAATTWTVQDNGDGAANAANCPGAGCRLRDALAATTDGDTINFSVTTPATITLNSGQLVVSTSVTVSGPGADQLSVDGNATSSVFSTSPGKTVTISGLTITNGSASAGGGILNNHATLTINNCTISGNTATNGGGGVLNEAANGNATMTINYSTLSGNTATVGGGVGGGVFNDGVNNGNATMTINYSTLSGNAATNVGGGVLNNGNAGNATLTIKNSTLSGNSATTAGGGIFNIASTGSNATLTLGNTILNAGDSGENIFNSGGSVTSLGYNISSDDGGGFLTATTDHINTDPLLGPLQNNGGPTFTHLPSPGSPAIGAGNPLIDQRGPGFDSPITVGAVQVHPTATPSPTPSPSPTPTPEQSPTPTPTPTSTPTSTPTPHPTHPPHPTPHPH